MTGGKKRWGNNPRLQCRVEAALPSVCCPVSGSNLHVTDSAGMPSYHHNHQLALQLRVNKCECRLQEIFYFWQKYSTFGRNIRLLAEIFYFCHDRRPSSASPSGCSAERRTRSPQDKIPHSPSLHRTVHSAQGTGHTLNTQDTTHIQSRTELLTQPSAVPTQCTLSRTWSALTYSST